LVRSAGELEKLVLSAGAEVAANSKPIHQLWHGAVEPLPLLAGGRLLL